MRRIAPLLLTLTFACGGVDDAPLGGPYGGQTDPTDPNGGSGDPNSNNSNNTNTNTGSDGGSTTTTKDSGTTTTKDSGTTTTKDSGTTTQDSGGQQTQTAPTWTQIYTKYLAGGTTGRCSNCHSQGSSKGSLYSWLQGKGYISGTSSALVDSNQSCLSWYGGNMPTSGPSSYPAAVSDMNAWAAAGAQNN